jgi:hypothetical protein
MGRDIEIYRNAVIAHVLALEGLTADELLACGELTRALAGAAAQLAP